MFAQVPKTQTVLEAEIKAKVLPRFEGGLDNALKGVEALKAIQQNEVLQDLVKSSGSLEAAGAALEAADKSLFYDNRFGATAGRVAQSFAEDYETIATSFSQCQDKAHSLAQIVSEPRIDISKCETKIVFAGARSGLCGFCVPMPSWVCGGCYRIRADLVNYSFPTFKIDASEQPYQSVYLNEEIVKARYMPQNDAMMKASGAMLAQQNLKAVQLSTSLNLAANGVFIVDTPAAIEFPKNLDATHSELPSILRTTVGDSSRIYTRNITEPLNIQTLSQWWIPHVAQFHSFGSDQPPWLALASRSLGLAKLSTLASPKMMFKFVQFLAPGGVFSCVEYNKKSGKTAIDLDTPKAGFMNKDLCLKNIGERFPLTDTRRVSITDRTWRGIAKDLDLFQAVTPEANRHTFREEQDRMLVLRNEKLKNESPVCRPLHEMTRVNIDYETANSKDIKSGGENAVEVFTKFKGCWGFKGRDLNWWLSKPGGFVKSIDGGNELRLK